MVLLLESELVKLLKSGCPRNNFILFFSYSFTGNYKNKIANFFVTFATGGNFMLLSLQLENRKKKIRAINPKSNRGKLWLHVEQYLKVLGSTAPPPPHPLRLGLQPELVAMNFQLALRSVLCAGIAYCRKNGRHEEFVIQRCEVCKHLEVEWNGRGSSQYTGDDEGTFRCSNASQAKKEG